MAENENLEQVADDEHLRTLSALLPAEGVTTATSSATTVEAEATDDVEAEASVVEGDETTTTTEAATSGISDELVGLATSEYGMSPEEARAYTTPEQLLLTMRAIDRTIGKLTREQSGQTAAKAGQQGATEAEQAKAPEPFAFQEFDLDSLKEEFDEPALELAAKIKAHGDAQGKQMAEALNMLRDQNDKLQQRLENIDRSRQAEKVSETTRMMDKFFSELPSEYRADFGGDPLSKLPESSPQRAARIQFYNAMTEVQRVRESLGQRPLDFSELQSHTLKVMYADRLEEITRNKLAADAKAAASKTLLRPTGRDKVVSNDPKVRAAAAANEWYRKHMPQPTG